MSRSHLGGLAAAALVGAALRRSIPTARNAAAPTCTMAECSRALWRRSRLASWWPSKAARRSRSARTMRSRRAAGRVPRTASSTRPYQRTYQRPSRSMGGRPSVVVNGTPMARSLGTSVAQTHPGPTIRPPPFKSPTLTRAARCAPRGARCRSAPPTPRAHLVVWPAQTPPPGSAGRRGSHRPPRSRSPRSKDVVVQRPQRPGHCRPAELRRPTATGNSAWDGAATGRSRRPTPGLRRTPMTDPAPLFDHVPETRPTTRRSHGPDDVWGNTAPRRIRETGRASAAIVLENVENTMLATWDGRKRTRRCAGGGWPIKERPGTENEIRLLRRHTPGPDRPNTPRVSGSRAGR
jgi:hypothetical protein